jgi:hypothetical protein
LEAVCQAPKDYPTNTHKKLKNMKRLIFTIATIAATVSMSAQIVKVTAPKPKNSMPKVEVITPIKAPPRPVVVVKPRPAPVRTVVVKQCPPERRKHHWKNNGKHKGWYKDHDKK